MAAIPIRSEATVHVLYPLSVLISSYFSIRTLCRHFFSTPFYGETIVSAMPLPVRRFRWRREQRHCNINIIIAIFDRFSRKCYNSSNERHPQRGNGENGMEYLWDTPSDIAMRLSGNMRRIRKRRKITQKQLAARSNVSYATLRKFEQTGQISLESFIKLSMELGLTGELNTLFTQPVYQSIEEVINDRKQNA